MSLRSLYGSGPDEEEIWGRIIDPSHVPTSVDNEMAEHEKNSLASNEYQERQAEIDEQNSLPTDLAQAWLGLSEEQRATIRQMIDELRGGM